MRLQDPGTPRTDHNPVTGPRTQFETVYRPLVGPLFSTAGFQEIRREPIPWCTTHDRDAHMTTWSVKEQQQTPGGCGEVRLSDECYEDITRCIVSTGGPDHKWWRDS